MLSPLDIVYTPLSIPTLKTDSPKVYDWIRSVYPQKERSITTPSYGAETVLGDKYPWNICFGKYGKWIDKFDLLFPEICEYATAGFGLAEEDIFALVLLPIKDSRLGPGFWHSDPDPTGLRFFIENENHLKNPIEFICTKEPFEDRPKIFSYIAELQNSTIFRNEILKGEIVSNNQAFYLNNIRAIHRPVVNVAGRRIAVIICPGKLKINSVKEKVKDLIVKSAAESKCSIYW